jgi:hypothetical protein
MLLRQLQLLVSTSTWLSHKQEPVEESEWGTSGDRYTPLYTGAGSGIL